MQYTTHHTYPPFEDNVQTAPLVTISLQKLLDGDASESKAFFDSACQLGFFYLNLLDSPMGERMVQDAERLHKVQQDFFGLPNPVKDEYTTDKVDKFFAYRFIKSGVKGADGEFIRQESLNMRKDDIVGNTPWLKTHPMILDQKDLLLEFTRDSRSTIDLMISILEQHLGLATGQLAQLHRVTERSGDHVRFNQAANIPHSEERAKSGEHTDFGTLTILFNWVGGLQIRLPDTDKWVWVKPRPGHAVINLGDALVKFTAGILRSNIHRVVPPVGAQAGCTRNSLVYFSRPEDSVVLRRIKGGIIDEQPVDDEGPAITSEEWIMRRSSGDLKGVYTHKGGLELRTVVFT